MAPVNTFSTAEIGAIAERSSRLTERLSGKFIPAAAGGSLGARRLARWRDVAAKGDPARFAAILASVGADRMPERDLSTLLGQVQLPPGESLPQWASFLGEMVSAISSDFAAARHVPGLTGNSSIPYVELYRPIAALARQRLQGFVRAPHRLLTEGAWNGLERCLLQRLSTICSPALHPSFLAFKAVRDSGMAFRIFGAEPAQPGGEKRDSLYQSFVKAQGAQGLAPFFIQHPAAARLSAETTLLWVDFVGEFLLRLGEDGEAIQARFNDCQPLGAVTRIKADISDPHRGGRTVAILSFAGGLRLVYKPRPMAIDLAFFALIDRLNACGFKPALRALAILDRASHGWMEFARHTACRNEAEAARFYQRAGALMSLIHLLGGVDFHRENMVAAGDQPLLVDLEGLCHPAVPENESGWPFGDSVLRTGMLPVWRRFNDEGQYFNNSALSGPLGQRSAQAVLRWKSINRDEMQAAYECSRSVCRNHRPRLNGRVISPRKFLPDLVTGFRRMASLLTGKRFREELDARIARMDALPARHIKRPTVAYATLLRRSLRPQFLIEGVDRSIELQALPLAEGGEYERNAELAALEILDVPYFVKTDPVPAARRTDGRVEKAGFNSQIPAIEAALKRRLIVP